ncbi:hypothetical protein QAD02_004459 [Eretmocerus hayati]|uniref:Uncharacterized protein n=1 Tax=Eretmocerus hayati TaxID=131215 RepID=A0ACC2NSJ1_9HYME|nr:hypothetical protein QAD02_004459 [Eretmocerus hayati]
MLLKFGADFTLKDHNGHTALRLYMNSFELDDEIIELILDAHVEKYIYINPVDNYNLSHFHIACATKHKKAILFFKKFCPVDDVVHPDSPIMPNFSISSNEVIGEKVLNEPQTIDISLKTSENTLEENSRKRHVEQDIDADDIAAKKQKISDDFEECFFGNPSSDPVDELMSSCFEGSPEEVKKVLESNQIDLSQKGIGERALYLACRAENIISVKTLVEHGADFFGCFGDQKILDLCIQTFGWKVLELLPLIDTLDDSCKLEKKAREFCLTLLQISNMSFLDTEHFNELNEFINSSCMSSKSKIWQGATILHLIAKFTHDKEKFGEALLDGDKNKYASIEILDCLIDCGADFLIPDAHGRTVLHQAFYDGNFEIAKKILHKHYCVQGQKNLVDNMGLSHFHIACALNDNNSLAYFRKRQINIRTKITNDIKLVTKTSVVDALSGSTPLHTAVSNRDWKTVRYLILRGADIFDEDDNGLTPIHYATVLYDESQANDDWKQIISRFMYHPDIKIANPSLFDGSLSHLHMACSTNRTEVITSLVKHGADVNAPPLCSIPGNENIKKNIFTVNTPLQIAYKFNNQRTLEMLAVYGANLNAQNLDGLNCLHMALIDWLGGCPKRKINQIVNMMNFNWRSNRSIDKTGLTQLHVACA